MIKIELINDVGEKLWLGYDQHRGLLYNEDGTRYELPEAVDMVEQHPSPKSEPARISKDNPGKKSSDVKTLKIQLGLNCNYDCSYCLQATHVADASVTKLDDAKNFIDNLDTWLTSTPQRIEFWGGEPLLYLKKIRYMAPRLREKFPYVEFVIITNGSLLNDSVVDFINEYDVGMALSHDGPGQWLRGPDPLEDPVVVSAVQRLIAERKGKFSINAVLSKETMDFAQVREWFDERLGVDAPINLGEIIAFYDNHTLQNQRFTPQELSELEDRLFYDLVGADSTALGPREKVVEALKMFYNEKESKYLGQKCGMDRSDVLSCDLNGEIMTCQNVAPVGEHHVGSVYEIKAAEVKSSTHWSHRDMCRSCPVVQLCKGSCMFLHGEKFDASCETSFAYNMASLKAALFMITGFVPVGMHGNILRPAPKRKPAEIIAVG